MANKIIIKNGAGAPANGVLDIAELGFDVQNKRLYIGDSENTNMLINPPEVTVDLEGANQGSANGINADTLGGYAVEDFVQAETFENYVENINASIKGSTKLKAGFIYPLAGSVIPEGFLLCDGAEYERVEYPELFAAIGTIYGSGDGSTTFNVPNLQTRVPVGAGNGYGLGAVGGEATHTLTVDEMPSHTHIVSNYTSSVGWQGNSPSRSYLNNTDDGYTGSNNPASKATGGGQPHNNMQPYTVVNYIIATGKDTGVSVSDIVMGAQALPLEVQYGGTGATNAADARKNLGITPENIGALAMDLLWENASPASEFAEQNVSIDLSQYPCIGILCYKVTDPLILMGLRIFTKTTIGARIGINEGAKFVQRTIKTITNDGVHFGAGVIYNTYAGSASGGNGYVIPYRIYGIKGVSV